MTRETLVATLRMCADVTTTERCEKCPAYDKNADCVSKLMNAAQEEIVFMDALLTAHERLEETLRKKVAELREAMGK